MNTRGSWKSPILLASLAAVGMRVAHVPVPDWLIETARMLGAVTVPLMLLSLGHALALIPSGGVRDGARWRPSAWPRGWPPDCSWCGRWTWRPSWPAR